ncbi:AAA family ATPase [Sphaerotilaceae bacterium SBD11-9]
MDPLAAWRLGAEPYYQASGDEIALFEAAHASGLPLLLKGPTGCGKTRFVEHMAWRLRRPLITVACHDDLSAADLVGRWLLDAQGGTQSTRWQDGPLTLAVRFGAICYLDEVVEARADTTVVLHPLADSRRALPLAACNELVPAHADFRLVVSYNPGYQAAFKELKMSTRQRFCALDFGYPPAAIEAAIVAHESGVPLAQAEQLVQLALRTRRLQGQGLDEGASTRMLVHAGRLMQAGLNGARACRAAVTGPLTDEPELTDALDAIVRAFHAE